MTPTVSLPPVQGSGTRFIPFFVLILIQLIMTKEKVVSDVFFFSLRQSLRLELCNSLSGWLTLLLFYCRTVSCLNTDLSRPGRSLTAAHAVT